MNLFKWKVGYKASVKTSLHLHPSVGKCTFMKQVQIKCCCVEQMPFADRLDYPANTRRSVHGLGTGNAKRRPELIYSGKYDLRISDNDKIFDLELKLDL